MYLEGLDRYTWAATAYFLDSAGLVPVFGKFSDLFSPSVIEIFALAFVLIADLFPPAATHLNRHAAHGPRSLAPG